MSLIETKEALESSETKTYCPILMDSTELKSLLKNIIECSRGKIGKSDIIRLLTSFKDSIRRNFLPLSAEDKTIYIEEHYNTLSAIKFELEYLVKEQHMQPNVDIIRLRDRIYADMLRAVHIQNETRKVTQIFNEFLKGITYFSNQQPINNQPVYHRPGYSCREKQQPNEECQQTNTNANRQSKKARIRICYIERLVYDELWSKLLFSPQDIGHIQWLGDTKKAYQTCFENKNLFIELEMNKRNTKPISLKIFEHDKIEQYEKPYDDLNEIYTQTVYCYKIDDRRNKFYSKENTFEQEGVWVENT